MGGFERRSTVCRLCGTFVMILHVVIAHSSISVCTSARATLEILIPDFVKQTSEEKPVEGDELEVLLLFGFTLQFVLPEVLFSQLSQLFMYMSSAPQYFNHISIEDSRVYELTNKAGLLSPYQILHECLKR